MVAEAARQGRVSAARAATRAATRAAATTAVEARVVVTRAATEPEADVEGAVEARWGVARVAAESAEGGTAAVVEESLAGLMAMVWLGGSKAAAEGTAVVLEERGSQGSKVAGSVVV